MYTAHETILSYMTLSENTKRIGYPQLHEAFKLGWYKLFKKTKESIVRKWVPLNPDSTANYPHTLENLIGVYTVDDCGDLAALYEDNAKNIIPQLDINCTCTVCNSSDCLCPLIQDNIVQTDVVIDGITRTNKISTRILKNGDVVEESFIWVPAYNSGSIFTAAQQVIKQTLKCKVSVKPCGCPLSTTENIDLLYKCGCLVDNCIPSLRKDYPALDNDFGYYKKDDNNRVLFLFDANGKKSILTQALFVFQSNGSDMIIADYARPCATALLHYTRMQYSPSFDRNDRLEAKKNYNKEKNEMIKYLNPIPYQWMVEVTDSTKKYYRGIHSDFVKQQQQQPIVINTPAAVPDNITNITYTNATVGTRFLKEEVDGGNAESPVSGLNTYQSIRLIGLGNNSNDKVEIIVDAQEMQNWGQAASFSFDKVLGKITFTGGYIWQPLSSLKIDLFQ